MKYILRLIYYERAKYVSKGLQEHCLAWVGLPSHPAYSWGFPVTQPIGWTINIIKHSANRPRHGGCRSLPTIQSGNLFN